MPTASKRGPELTLRLLTAPDYRTFIRVLCGDSTLSYSALARRAGFSSRAYVREVIEGKRRLTLPSVTKFSKGLSLEGEMKRYFQLLVARTEADSLTEGWDRRILEEKLNALRSRLSTPRKRRERKDSSAIVDRYLAVPGFLEIYASSGRLGEGSTLEEIQARTKMEREILASSLAKMVKLGVFTLSDEGARFIPVDFHMALGEAASSVFFRAVYLKNLERSRALAISDFHSKEKLFLQSTFCVRKGDAVLLKAKLREMITRFVDQQIDDNGEQVVTLVTALT